MNLFITCLLSLIAFSAAAKPRSALVFGGAQMMTVAKRDALHYFQPKKGSNQAVWPELVKDAPAVKREAMASVIPPFPEDDGPCVPCETAVPFRATFTVFVPPLTNRYASGKKAVTGYYAVGLERSLDGGKTWQPWVKRGNDTFRQGDFSITMICDGESSKHIKVRAFATNEAN